jgi:hypothetical protein
VAVRGKSIRVIGLDDRFEKCSSEQKAKRMNREISQEILRWKSMSSGQIIESLHSMEDVDVLRQAFSHAVLAYGVSQEETIALSPGELPEEIGETFHACKIALRAFRRDATPRYDLWSSHLLRSVLMSRREQLTGNQCEQDLLTKMQRESTEIAAILQTRGVAV